MKKLRIAALLLAGAGVLGLGLTRCSDDQGCPGKVCSNCAASGDCDLTCAPPQVNFCGHFGLFEDQRLRCSFCERPDFQF